MTKASKFWINYAAWCPVIVMSVAAAVPGPNDPWWIVPFVGFTTATLITIILAIAVHDKGERKS